MRRFLLVVVVVETFRFNDKRSLSFCRNDQVVKRLEFGPISVMQENFVVVVLVLVLF